jgi:predicted small lipoprotein YifL
VGEYHQPLRRLSLFPYILPVKNHWGKQKMQKITRWNTLALLICALLMLSACGQKGDLYLPEGQFNSVAAG